MPAILLWGLSISGIFAIFGYGSNQAGQAIDKTSNGLVKVAVAGSAIYYIGKKFKWL